MSQFNRPPAFRLPKCAAVPPPPTTSSRSPTRRQPAEDARSQQLSRCAPGNASNSAEQRGEHERTRRGSLPRQERYHKRASDAGSVLQAVTRHIATERDDQIDREEDEEMPDYAPARQQANNKPPRRESSPLTTIQDTSLASNTNLKRRRLDAPRPTYRSLEPDIPAVTQSAPRFRMPSSTAINSTDRNEGVKKTPTFNTPRPFPTFSSISQTQSMPPPPPTFTSTPSLSSTTTATMKRPRFIIPSEAAAYDPTQPRQAGSAERGGGLIVPAILPDIFSPHKRKHERFVPGGWASQVRGWVLDISSSPSLDVPDAFTRATEPGREVEMLIQDVEMANAGGGVRSVGVVQGRAGIAEVGVLVVGDGGGRRAADDSGLERRERSVKGDVRVGDKMMLGCPAWEVELDGKHGQRVDDGEAGGRGKERWIVAPVWKMA